MGPLVLVVFCIYHPYIVKPLMRIWLPEQEVAQKMQRETVRPQPSLHGGVIVRIPKVTMKDLLYDWGGVKELLMGSELDEAILQFMKDDMKNVQVCWMNCPKHGYIHIQLVPVDKEPMHCAEAEKE